MFSSETLKFHDDVISNPASLAETEIDGEKFGTDFKEPRYVDVPTVFNMPNPNYDTVKFSESEGETTSTNAQTMKIHSSNQQSNPESSTPSITPTSSSSSLKQAIYSEGSTGDIN